MMLLSALAISGSAEARARWHMGGSNSVFAIGKLRRSPFAIQ